MNTKHTSNDIIVGLSGCTKLADLISQRTKIKKAEILISNFADGESFIKICESVKGKHVYVIQSTCPPVNKNLMELLITIDILKRSFVKLITVICPYYGYARQDRLLSKNEPLTAKLVANLLEKSGVDNIYLLDPHSSQIQGFFNIPNAIISGIHFLMNEIKKKNNLKDFVIVSPDYGSVKRIKNLSEAYKIPMLIINKNRPQPNVVEIVDILGANIKNKNCLVIDDMIDTGGTIITACKTLKKMGCKKIIVGCIHGILSTNAIEKFNLAYKSKIIDQLFVSNSIDSIYTKKIKNLHIVDISSYLTKNIFD